MNNKYNYYRSDDNSHKLNSIVNHKHNHFKDEIAQTSPALYFFSKSRQKLINSKQKDIIASQQKRLRTLQNKRKQEIQIFQKKFNPNNTTANRKIVPYETQIIKNKIKEIHLSKSPKKKGLNVISTSKIVKKSINPYSQYNRYEQNEQNHKNQPKQMNSNSIQTMPQHTLLAESNLKYWTPKKMRKSCEQLFQNKAFQTQSLIESDGNNEILKLQSNVKKSQNVYLNSIKGKQEQPSNWQKPCSNRLKKYINIEDNSQSIKKINQSFEKDQNPQYLQKSSIERSPYRQLRESKYMSPWIQELDQRLHAENRLNNKMPFRQKYQQKCKRQQFERLIQQNYLALRSLSQAQIEALFEQLKRSKPQYEWRNKIVKYVYSKLKRVHQYQKFRNSIKK